MSRPRTVVRCRRDGCGATFEVDEGRIGRNVHCLDCGNRMTAVPVDVEARLRRRPSASGGAAGSVDRLPLVGLVDNVRSLWNVGSIFRTADACGMSRLVLAGITGHPPRDEISKTALGAEDAVPWRYVADSIEALRAIRDDGFVTVALESTARAEPLDSIEWPPRVCLVVGNEVAGVARPLLEACEVHASIPMRGIKDSLNVAVAFGIGAWAASSHLGRRKPPRRQRG